MKKFLLSIALCGTLAAQASEVPEAAPVRAKMSHNIDITAGGGIGSLGYDLQGGRQYPAYTYTWFFVPGTGLQTGVQLTRLGSVASLTGSYVWQDLLTDASGDQYEHRMTFADWYEQQEAYLLEIPLGFTLHHYGRNNPRAGVYAALGAKLQIPLFADYRHHSGSVTHSGYYPYWDLTLQDLPDRFITEQTDVPQQGSFLQHLNRWNAAVYMELGTTIRCGAHTELIISAYGQYTVTDLLATPVSRLTALGFANSRNGGGYQTRTVRLDRQDRRAETPRTSPPCRGVPRHASYHTYARHRVYLRHPVYQLRQTRHPAYRIPAIALFGDKDSKGLVLLKTYDEVPTVRPGTQQITLQSAALFSAFFLQSAALYCTLLHK